MQKVYHIILSYHRFPSLGKSNIQVAKMARYSLRHNLEKGSLSTLCLHSRLIWLMSAKCQSLYSRLDATAKPTKSTFRHLLKYPDVPR